MRLVDVYDADGSPREGAVVLLYKLLEERPQNANISHLKLPPYEQHKDYVKSKPYRCWYVVMNGTWEQVGMINATWGNEIGIGILRAYRRQGYGRAAVGLLMAEHKPQPTGLGCWLANVAPMNYASKRMFEALGGKIVQVTYALGGG